MHVRPIDIPTEQTVRFVTAHAPPGSRLLEIGCGQGHVALELSRRGYQVRAIDASPECVEQARALGVPAELASWPDGTGRSADVVLFTRSLHHIHPLQPAVTPAREVLGPSGCLLVEDFAFRSVDRPTLEWFVDSTRTLSAEISLRPDELATTLLQAADPCTTWHENHPHHHLHPFPTMQQAIRSAFEIRQVEEVPYLYRYLLPALSDTPEAADRIANLLREEIALGGQRRILLVGRRLVAGLRTEAPVSQPFQGAEAGRRTSSSASRRNKVPLGRTPPGPSPAE